MDRSRKSSLVLKSVLLVGCFALAISSPASPPDEMATKAQVRHGIVVNEFGPNIFLRLGPLPVVLGLVFLAYWAVPGWKHSSKKSYH
ncbi:MAG: hypothetical protein JWM68_561 [Verrucomicrobiales bacterium]|nr:hypothetical protein [Verrucomicrobiales bacterium]